MFWLRLHSVGSTFSVETPVPKGPLHWGQFSPQAGIQRRTEETTKRRMLPPVLVIIAREASVPYQGTNSEGEALKAPACTPDPPLERSGNCFNPQRRGEPSRAPFRVLLERQIRQRGIVLDHHPFGHHQRICVGGAVGDVIPVQRFESAASCPRYDQIGRASC